MDETIEVVVVRVFTNESGRNGNELGIVQSSEATASREQEIASALGFSETVFLDGRDESTRDAAIRIFTPARELPFAGHPSVGTAWWLSDRRTPVDVLIEPAGDVEVTVDDDTAWATARPEWAPAFEWLPLQSPEDVEALDPFAFTTGHHYAYAWIDEAAGRLRSRMFAPDMGIIEDEATGAAAIALSARLGRSLSILQGEGSELLTELLDDGRVRVGGTTVYDRTIEATL